MQQNASQKVLAPVFHSVIKAVYLLMSTAVLPVAVYVIRQEPLLSGADGAGLFFFLSLYVLGPLYVIFFIGLGIYLFPRNIGQAVLVVVSFILPFVAIVLTGQDTLIVGAYTVFHASLLSLVVFWLGSLILFLVRPQLLGYKKLSWRVVVGGFVFAVILLIFSWTASVPFFSRLIETHFGVRLLGPIIAIILQALYGAISWFLVLRRRRGEKEQKEMDLVWGRWIPWVVAAFLVSLLTSLGILIF